MKAKRIGSPTVRPKLSEHLLQLSDIEGPGPEDTAEFPLEYRLGLSAAYLDAATLARAYEAAGAPSPVSTLPDAPAQYLFLRPDGDFELWRLTVHGWFDASGTHYDSPLERNPGLTQWGRARL